MRLRRKIGASRAYLISFEMTDDTNSYAGIILAMRVRSK
jgi:hypothetical protein